MLLCAKVTSDGKSEVVFTLKHGDNKQGCAVQPIPGGEVILDTEALSSGEPKPIISNVARGQYWKLLAEGHHLITSL